MSQTEIIEHVGDTPSNEFRRRIAGAEPRALRTVTRSLAVIERSSGAYHWTPEGHKLADFSSGVLVANLGHNPTAWWRRVLELLAVGDSESEDEHLSAAPLTAYNAITPLEVEACDLLLNNLRGQPGGQRMEQVLWAASGSEAIQKALWSAMKFQGARQHIVATRGGFHGKKGLAGAVTGGENDSERDPRVHFVGFPKSECDDLDTRRQPLDLTPYKLEMESLKAQFGNSIGTVITEPYLGGGGSYHPQAEYLQWLEQECRENGWLFILDEIQSNFGRTGPMYAFTHYGVTPDLVCLGKGLGNGAPVAAAVGRSDVLESLNYGEGSDTYSANPIACAAVVATLEQFESQNALQRGAQLAETIESGLTPLKETGVIVRIRGEGCVWGIECQSIGKHSADDVAHECVRACYLGDSQGRRIHLLGPLAGCVLRISPPLTMAQSEAAEYFQAMREIFSDVAARLNAE